MWTAGVQPHPVLRNTDLPLDEKGRIKVGADLHVVATQGVWSAGDSAAVPDLTNLGATTPPTAQHAVRQARENVQQQVFGAYTPATALLDR